MVRSHPNIRRLQDIRKQAVHNQQETFGSSTLRGERHRESLRFIETAESKKLATFGLILKQSPRHYIMRTLQCPGKCVVTVVAAMAYRADGMRDRGG